MLAYHDLAIEIRRQGRWVEAVSGVRLAVAPGRVVGLVGESGCGKTLTALAALRLHEAGVRVARGDVLVDGERVGAMDERALLRLRGGVVAMVFQEPMTALNPVFSIRAQIFEVLRRHRGLDRAGAEAEARALLAEVGITDPARVLASYPDALSGGMRQRVLIAMALAGRPRYLVADEPTTALDVSVQRRIVELLARMQQAHGLGMLLITHDFGLVAELCDEVAVIYAGQIVERAPVAAIFDDPRHPYTQALLGCRPEAAEAPAPIPGQAPEPGAWPSGCRFRDRCPHAGPACGEPPPWVDLGKERGVRCVREA